MSLLVVNLAPVAPFAGHHENWMLPDSYDVAMSSSLSWHHQCVLDTEGILYPCSWVAMETAEGVYDFSALTTTLNYAATYGKKVIVRIFTKTVSAAKPKPLPAYILNDEVTYGGDATTGGLRINRFSAWSPRLDNPNVMARYKALITAMAAAVGNHSALQGIGPDESAWGFGELWPVAGLTTGQIRDAHREMCLHIQSCFPGKEIYPFYNYCDGSEDAEVVAELNWSIGQGMYAGLSDTHRIPDMQSGIPPVATAFPMAAKTIMCVDYMSVGEDDSGVTERMLENARTTALRGADITVWLNWGGASGNWWAAAKNAMAIIG
ncbi:hypothetical protein [Nitrosovibrio sp. Nv4]|uniref:hypothetical protein n=1 Tax=Nitrosovibrio sp. Nv4 TaxID=1945880 RepID=UPI000BD13242|nr:hypothetical protein [Nitrosovibrio sp. Nv4]SOD42377.1 hypothetical protein SAMN06298226_2716 [Nitrosovibrio sp. Nv4]